MAILSKACKPDKFESHNSLKLSFTNICSLHLNYVDCESPESKVKFRQASNCCKRVLKAAKLAYASKTSRKLGSQDLLQIANSVIKKGTSAIHTLFNGLKVLFSASDKAKLFAKNFSKNSNLDDSGISLPVFPSRITLKLHAYF